MAEPLSSSIPGYHGCYLRVDLDAGDSARVALQSNDLRRFIGGSGLGCLILLREGAAAVDPLSPAAPLAFVFSPLVGSPLTTSAKFAVVCKSPLTERFNDSLASSTFAIAGKACGCDAIVIVGRTKQPSVLVIDDGAVRIEPAEDAWGLPIDEADATLRTRFGADFQMATIGPAGENLVHFATISHDNRHAGRGGSGAVMGSKNLKAIAVRGGQQPRFSGSHQLVEKARSLSRRSFGPATAKYRELGTAANLLAFNRLNTLPTRNFQQSTFDGAESLAPEQLAITRHKTRATCAVCTIGCQHIYSIDPTSEDRRSGSPSDPAANGVRLEYESLFALGPLCEISDATEVLQASQLCDRLGLDTVSAGGTIAFAMECNERGLIDEPWLRFGDGQALLRALDTTAHRRGFGNRLADGSRRLAMEIGGGAIAFAPQVKGLEIPGYEPRTLQMMALGFAVGTRGADHNRSGAYEVDFSDQVEPGNAQPSDVALAIATEDRAAIMDSLILCKFLRGVLDDFYGEAAEMLQLTTGWDITPAELQRTARRIVTAKKLFNIRAGWTPDEDSLPARFLDSDLPAAKIPAISRGKLAAMISSYNTTRGWTDEGWIADDALLELELEAV
ncbi:MAG: aldehyde ferredoxin oxidoreductase family protein [Pirellulales bacterium]